MSGSAGVTWRFLGRPEILGHGGGDVTPLLGRKAIGVLAYLAADRRATPRDEIARLLWPGQDVSRSLHNLRQCLVTMRKAMGEDFARFIEANDDRLAVAGEVTIDVRELAEIEAGRPVSSRDLADLCRGHFLQGFAVRAAPFDEWVATERARLDAIACRALVAARLAARRAGNRAELARIDGALAALGVAQTSGTAEAVPSGGRGGAGIRRWTRRSAPMLAGVALVALALLVGAYSASPQMRDSLASVVLGVPKSPPRIAVLPFTTVNGTAEEANLAGGVTLGVNYGLYAITARELFVVTTPPIPRDLQQPEMLELAGAYGVRYLISGSVELVGPTVRVLVQLLDAGGDTVVWRRHFEKEKSHAFKLQDDITLEILQELDIELSPAERHRIQYLDDTENLYAWLAAANGVRHLIRVKRRDIELAERFYAEALRHDPEYVSAMRGLAWIRVLRVRLGWAENVETTILEASDMLQAILRRKPTDGLALSLQGLVQLLVGDYTAAVRSGEQAMEYLPGSADVTAVLAHTLTYVGQQDRALELIERAMELSPMHPDWYRWTKGRALRMSGRLGDSIHVLEDGIEADDAPLVHLVELAGSYSAAGMMGEAHAIAGRIRDEEPKFSASLWLRHPPVSIPEVQSREYEYLARIGL